MKVLKAAHRLPGHATCECGSELEFTIEDVREETQQYGWAISVYKYFYIKCPICKNEIELPNDLNSVMPWVTEE